MNILHTIPHIGRLSAGPSASVLDLCEVTSSEVNVQLISLDSIELTKQIRFLKTFNTLPVFKKLGISCHMKSYIKEMFQKKEFDLVHAHSLWMMPNIYPIIEAYKYKVPSILSPRGTLSSHAFRLGSSFKPFFWALFQKSAVTKAKYLHATSELEAEDFRRLGFKQPIIVIPNGIRPIDDVQKNIYREGGGTKKLLFLGRLHPVKGLEKLLESWGMLQEHFTDWELVIAGPDIYGHKLKLLQIINNRKLTRIQFPGEVAADDKYALFREAHALILPSYSENFGMVIAEALLMNTPVVVSAGCPWIRVVQSNAGWVFDHEQNNLTEVLVSLFSAEPQDLIQKGKNGRKLILEQYASEQINSQWQQVYNWILKKSNKPLFVYES